MSTLPLLLYRVLSNQLITSNVTCLECVPQEGECPTFTAGQFMMIHWCDGEGKCIDRPHAYSIASAPHEGRIMFSIKVQGPYTTRLSQEIKAGDILQLQGPFGAFTLEKVTIPNIVMLAGGVGIAPFRSILHDELDNPAPKAHPPLAENTANSNNRTFQLLYSDREPSWFPFKKDIDELAAKHTDAFRVVYTATDNVGEDWKGLRERISADTIKREVKDWEGATYLLCGPPPFIKGMKEQLALLGIPVDRVKLEGF